MTAAHDTAPHPVPPAASAGPLRELTVVVPVRDAEALLAGCLASVVREQPAGLLVVDGGSHDRSVAVAERYGATVLTSAGPGPAGARMTGLHAARTRWVAFVDADVVVPPGTLVGLLAELRDGGYGALQAGLLSISGPGYWGRALVSHHRTGRSKDWFGVVATVADRELMLRHGFHSMASGEDIDLRRRLVRAGVRVGVSKRWTVVHRFAGDDFAFARGQWVADGAGLAEVVRREGRRGLPLLLLPGAAAVRGMALSVARGEPGWLPYYALFCLYNYAAMIGALCRGRVARAAAR